MIIGFRVIAGALSGGGACLFVALFCRGVLDPSTASRPPPEKRHHVDCFPWTLSAVITSLPKHQDDIDNIKPPPSRPSNPPDRSPANQAQQATRLTTTHCRPPSRPPTHSAN